MASRVIVDRLAIIGLGLMGASLGMAVKRRRMANTVVGYARRAETRNQALDRGIVDEVHECPERAVHGADLVVFCTPVGTISDLVKTCVSDFAEQTVVTDVGSSKAEIVAQVEPLFRDGRVMYVGSHPIAGSEQQGLEAACPDLYENAVVIVTPTKRTDQGALGLVNAFWQGLNARVLAVSPEEHDRLTARTSHVPHLVAAMLASSVGRDCIDRISNFCGSGFLDTTRISDAAPELWLDIIKSNQAAVAHELKEFEQQMRHVMKLVETGDFEGLRRFLDDSRTRRRKLLKKQA